MIDTLFIILFSSFWTVDREKKNILDRQQIASQWGLQLIFRMHNSDPTPQGVENRNILLWFKLVVYRSSETSTNQSDVIIRSDDRFLNLVVDSDSIVSKIYMLDFILWLFFLLFFFVSILTKILQFYSSWFFFPHSDKHLVVLSKRIFDTHWLSQYTYLD